MHDNPRKRQDSLVSHDLVSPKYKLRQVLLNVRTNDLTKSASNITVQPVPGVLSKRKNFARPFNIDVASLHRQSQPWIRPTQSATVLRGFLRLRCWRDFKSEVAAQPHELTPGPGCHEHLVRPARDSFVAELVAWRIDHSDALEGPGVVVDFVERLIRAKLDAHGPSFTTSGSLSSLMRNSELRIMTQRSRNVRVYRGPSTHLIRRIFLSLYRADFLSSCGNPVELPDTAKSNSYGTLPPSHSTRPSTFQAASVNTRTGYMTDRNRECLQAGGELTLGEQQASLDDSGVQSGT